MGYRVRLGPLAQAAASGARFAGTDAERAAELNGMFQDPEVRAIVCARGGYGVMRILDLLDYAAIRRDPKVVVGFSDITALHLALWRQAGLVTLHGRMAGMDTPWNAYDRASLQMALSTPLPLGPVPQPEGGPRMVTVVPGQAEGVLLGGNLSLIAALCGTPYELDTDGAIMLLEDVREPVYRIDRMLATLRLAGKLRGVRAVVFGETTGLSTVGDEPHPGLVELLREVMAPCSIPCFYGLAVGHGTFRATVPLGVRARVDAGAMCLELLEPALGCE